ncbi:acetate--CoA ligase [Clavibacter michiganensis subsp. michiganensis]|uniref:acetate--CoA ligase n=1 Tax=Clavibacter michiganensis TaxID=28447 RepID=UPI001D09B694|nr:acetate--CoA ligase [Clavibacter michiganensis]UDM12626.1 acetate--CoA ligase [Clavibacter michiganensis subsp. michiganensis]
MTSPRTEQADTASDHVADAEQALFPPPAALAAAANVTAEAYDRAEADPVAFWEEAARRLDWETPWETSHTWVPPVAADGTPQVPAATWFAGGRLNVAANCVDRHVAAGQGAKVALHFEGEPGDRRTVTYRDLQEEVSRAANALTALGVGPGDRVVIYLPVLVETIVATLAVARIGAVHSLVFGGFSAEALRFRVEDTGAKLLITSDGQNRRGTAVATKPQADEAVAGVASIEHVLVVRRAGQDVPWTPGRDVWWHDAVGSASPLHEPRAFDAEHPLFIIYTSGTTGRPKGLVHTSGGYLTHASWAHWAHFDAKPDDVHWCTADLAWVTAHTYEIYGPLSNGLTQVIYEGTPDTPHRGRHLEIIERYGVTTYYTAPTLIRSLMGWYPDGIAGHDLSSIRLLGSVGEAINPAAWRWFHREIGGGSAPVVDTWWQSETGAGVIAPLPGVSTLKPGAAGRALPGFLVDVVDDDGEPAADGEGGLLVIQRPWPGMARTVWGDPDRYRRAYWERFADRGWFLAGDGARRDADGDIALQGRIDEVVNVSGHRLSTIEIESALVAHPRVGEAGVTGVADDLTGQRVVAFVVPGGDDRPADDDADGWAALAAELGPVLTAHVARAIGPVAKPRRIVAVPDVPKTRSGKIMRRLLADLVEGRTLGDATSLQDAAVLGRIRAVLDASAR